MEEMTKDRIIEEIYQANQGFILAGRWMKERYPLDFFLLSLKRRT